MSAGAREGSCKLLIVDDDDDVVRSMRRYLTASGFSVDTASAAGQAEQLIAASRYEIAIVDLRLSPGDRLEGLDFLQFLRRHSPETRTIVLTAYGSPEVEATARDLGVFRFLNKPQPLAEIAQLARRCVVEVSTP